MHTFFLKNTEQTTAFGSAFAQGFMGLLSLKSSTVSLPAAALPAVLLHGELGAGKTTFTRGFVHALPYGKTAEVASPSFTLCHHYATEPPVLHGDLYRTQQYIPEEITDILDEGGAIVLLEWAEFLPLGLRPIETLDIHFEICHNGRLAKVQACGDLATRLLESLDNISWTKT